MEVEQRMTQAQPVHIRLAVAVWGPVFLAVLVLAVCQRASGNTKQEWSFGAAPNSFDSIPPDPGFRPPGNNAVLDAETVAGAPPTQWFAMVGGRPGILNVAAPNELLFLIPNENRTAQKSVYLDVVYRPAVPGQEPIPMVFDDDGPQAVPFRRTTDLLNQPDGGGWMRLTTAFAHTRCPSTDRVTIGLPAGGVFEFDKVSIITQCGAPRADLNGNSFLDPGDIDELYAHLGSSQPFYDLDNSGGPANPEDVSLLVHEFLQTRFGDANLDGRVNVLGDGSVLVANLGNEGGWARGDFDGDGLVSVLGDGQLLVANLGFIGPAAEGGFAAAAVPEPTCMIPLAALLVLHRRRGSGTGGLTSTPVAR
jgi:hypothetical protein